MVSNLKHELNSSQFDESVNWFPATTEVHQLNQALNVFGHLRVSFRSTLVSRMSYKDCAGDCKVSDYRSILT